MAIHVDAKNVTEVKLYKWSPLFRRLDVLPFAFIYSIFTTLAIPNLEKGDALIVLLALVAIHVLVFMFTVWIVDFRCFAHAQEVEG